MNCHYRVGVLADFYLIPTYKTRRKLMSDVDWHFILGAVVSLHCNIFGQPISCRMSSERLERHPGEPHEQRPVDWWQLDLHLQSNQFF